MLTVEQIETCLDAIRAENRLLARLVKQRKLEDEYKSYERSACRLPELDAVLAGTEDEASELIARYRL